MALRPSPLWLRHLWCRPGSRNTPATGPQGQQPHRDQGGGGGGQGPEQAAAPEVGVGRQQVPGAEHPERRQPQRSRGQQRGQQSLQRRLGRPPHQGVRPRPGQGGHTQTEDHQIAVPVDGGEAREVQEERLDRRQEDDGQGHHRHHDQAHHLRPAPPAHHPHTGQGQRDDPDIRCGVAVDGVAEHRAPGDREAVPPLHQQVDHIVGREGSSDLGPGQQRPAVAGRSGQHLQSGQDQRSTEGHPGHQGYDQVHQSTHVERTVAVGPPSQEQPVTMRSGRRSDHHGRYLGLAREQGQRHHHGGGGDAPRSSAASDNQDGQGEEPPGPRHHRSMGPAHPAEERPAELVDGSGGGAPDNPEAENAPQRIGPGPGDQQGHQDLHGVGEVERDEVAHRRREAEHRRLPVEGQRQTEAAVRVPQGDVAGMDLDPGQIGPRDHLADLIAGVDVADGDAGIMGKTGLGQDVVGTEGQAVVQGRNQDGQGGAGDPGQTGQMGQDPTAAPVRPRSAVGY